MNEHHAVPFDATPAGQPASYRCVRCKTHWPASTAAPATCTPPPPRTESA